MTEEKKTTEESKDAKASAEEKTVEVKETKKSGSI